MEKDLDVKLAKAIHDTTEELSAAKEVVRQLANELADVVDIIEPALDEQTRRLRQARMASLDETRQVAGAIREISDQVLAPSFEKTLVQCERFLKLMTELEEFRAVGALDAFLRAFGSQEYSQ